MAEKRHKKSLQDMDELLRINLVSFIEMLWTAPELIRADDGSVSKAGDIYSFAIICSEILTRRHAWNYTDRSESVEGVL
jgi:hypothetical protein